MTEGPTLVADIETDGLLPTLTTIWQISILNLETGSLVSYNDEDTATRHSRIAVALERLFTADRVVMHGGLMFDIPAIQKVHGPGAARWNNVLDTLVLSRLGNPERLGGHSLREWGERLGRAKPEHDDWSQWSPEMETRCNEDVQITAKVYERLVGMLDAMPAAVALEHGTAWEVTKMIRRGFGLDVPYCQKLASELMTEQEAITADLQTLFPPILVPAKASQLERTLKNVNRRHALFGQLDPGVPYCPVEVQVFNPGSRVQIAKRLVRGHAWRPRKFTPGGAPEISEDVLRDLPYAEATVLADYLYTEKQLGQLQAEPRANGSGGGWLHHAVSAEVGGRPHWRVHASFNPCRAVTGRPACSSPNIQQVSTAPRMRRAWVPRPGRVLVGVDAEGLELRCLAHYLWRYDDGAYAKILLEGKKSEGTDIHSVVQALLGFHDRNEVKRAEYGWLYGAGDAKLGLIAFQDAYAAKAEIRYDVLGISPKGKRGRPSNSVVGAAIRARLQEGIEGLGTLVDNVKRSCRRTDPAKLVALDGRSLWIRSEHSALNFLLQSAGIIIMKHAIAASAHALEADGLVEDADFALVMWIHDEVQYEARPEVAEQVGAVLVQQIVDAGPALGFRCPLAGSCDVGASWAKTH